MRSGEGRETTWLWTKGIRTGDRQVNVYLAQSSEPINAGARPAIKQVAGDKGAGVVHRRRDKVIGDVVGRFPPFPLRDGRKKV